MSHHSLELSIVLAVTGALLLVLGTVSAWIRRSWISGPILALLAGFLLGPFALGLVDSPDLTGHGAFLEVTAEATLALGVMAASLRIPPGFVRRQARSVAVLLAVAMPVMWLVTGGLTWWCAGVTWNVAILIGAVLAPTDPVLAGSIVTGPVAEASVPERLRHLLTAESGLNDGLAYPLVVTSLVLGWGAADGIRLELLTTLWEVAGAVLFGLVAGWITGVSLEWADRRRSIETTAYLVMSLCLTITVLAGARLLHANGILAVFVAGQAMAHAITRHERLREYEIQEAVTGAFILPGFLLFGLALPVGDWIALGWRGPLLVVAILLLRRLPVVLLLKRGTPAIARRRDALFAGWFGPIGVAAMYYACTSTQRTGAEAVWTIASLVIAASTIAHGITAVLLTRLYGGAGGAACEQALSGAPARPPGRG